MTGRELREALHAGQPVFGTQISFASPTMPPLVAGMGLDFVFIDTEHVPIDRSTLSWMCMGYDAHGLAPIVRIPAADPNQACMVQDGGARGVLVPYIEDRSDVAALVGAVKHRPLKGAVLDSILAGEIPADSTVADYSSERGRDSSALVNIESLPAVEAIDEIVAVPGLDGVVIGPHDLSVSLGRPEQYDDPGFISAARRVFSAARRAGIGAGIHLGFGRDGVATAVEWAAMGAGMIIYRSDLQAVLAMGGDIGAMRAALA
jgi:4-hydroxy-2-oxoheptanedioate aldolase